MGGMSHFVRRAAAAQPPQRHGGRLGPAIPAVIAASVVIAAAFMYGGGTKVRPAPLRVDSRCAVVGSGGSPSTIRLCVGNAVMPALGLGTWKSPPEKAAAAVRYALETGAYSHIDLSPRYGNQKAIGEFAFKPLFRKDPSLRRRTFIASKLWNTDHRPERVGPALTRTLQELQLDYLDLWYMHWPVAVVPGSERGMSVTHDTGVSVSDTWRAMEAELRKGRVRALGISNFNARTMRELLANAAVLPEVHQMEMHPLLPQGTLMRLCRDSGIAVVAYCPLGSPDNAVSYAGADATLLIKHPSVLSAAAAVNRTPAQVLLKWGMQRGAAVIPKSVTPRHITENAMARGSWQLPPHLVSSIDAIQPKGQRIVHAKHLIPPGWLASEFWEDGSRL